MTFIDQRQVTDPHRIRSFPHDTYINWRRDHHRRETHGCLMPGGDHLVTVYKTRSGWVAEADPDAVFDVGYAQERYTVPGEYGTPEAAVDAAERELYALLCRITSGVGREVTR